MVKDPPPPSLSLPLSLYPAPAVRFEQICVEHTYTLICHYESDIMRQSGVFM